MEDLAAPAFAYVARGHTLWARLDGGDGAATFDGEGRLLTARLGHDYFRRGLDNQVVKLTRRAGSPLPWSIARLDRGDELFAAVRRRLPAPDAGTTPRARALAARAALGLEAGFAADARRFAAVVGPVPVLPPNHSRAVVVRLTEGCAWDACRFCTLYSDVPFRVKSGDEFRRHVRAVLDYFGAGAGMRRSIYVGEASLLEAGVDCAIAALEILNQEVRVHAEPPSAAGAGSSKDSDLHAFEGLYAFSDVKRAAALAPADAARLAALGLRRLYLGVESGDDEVLRSVHKPHRAGDVGAAVRSLHRGGIGAGIILLVGPGGRTRRARHREATVALLATAGIDRRDFLFLSPLDARASSGASGGGDPLGPHELAEEVAILRRELKAALGADIRIADYQLDAFVF